MQFGGGYYGKLSRCLIGIHDHFIELGYCCQLVTVYVKTAALYFEMIFK
jgi:hypothetical protein